MAAKQPIEAFLAENPLTSRWLDDIVGELLNSANGTAHVREIVKVLWRNRDIDSIEETITRRINDYCSDALDFGKQQEHDLFERVAPATYRLRSYPNRPEILELVRIEFEEHAMQETWRLFTKKAQSKDSEKWNELSNRAKLDLFLKNFSKLRAYYEGVKRFELGAASVPPIAQ